MIQQGPESKRYPASFNSLVPTIYFREIHTMFNKICRSKFAYFTLLGCIVLCLQSCENNQETKQPLTQDELEIDRILKGAYHQWFVKKGDAPDFTNIHDYTTENATFHEVEKGRQTMKLLSDVVQAFEEAFADGHLNSFDEREVGAETIVIGNTAHRISYHVYRTNTNDRITQRGVNTIQLLRTSRGWRIQSIVRQLENEDYQLPKRYDTFK